MKVFINGRVHEITNREKFISYNALRAYACSTSLNPKITYQIKDISGCIVQGEFAPLRPNAIYNVVNIVDA